MQIYIYFVCETLEVFHVFEICPGCGKVTPADMDLTLVRMQDLFDKIMRRQDAATNQVVETTTKPSGAALTVNIDGKEYGVWH
jgi:hypothetical protein